MPPVRHVYILPLYKSPEQAHRLLTRLLRPGTRFLIHIDKRVDAAPLHAALAPLREHITYLKRFDSSWGGLGIVHATIEALRLIKPSAPDWDYVHLMSGHDYPIATPAAIDAFFAAAKGKNFMEFLPMPVAGVTQGGMNRLEEYAFVPRKRLRPRTEGWAMRVERLANRALRAVGHRRRFPSYASPYLGSNWWSITPAAADYMLRFIDRHPDYARFHRYTIASDEIFFSSILGSATDPALRASVVNDNQRHIVWDKPGQTEFPATLRTRDLDEILGSGKLWARKFDTAVDAQVLDLIDSRLASAQPA